MKSFPEEAFGSSKTITKKDRRVILILGYLYLVFAPFGLFISINKNYIIVLIIILLGIINLILSEFSLLFYAHQYYYFLKKDKCYNSKLIIDYYFQNKSSLNMFENYSKKYFMFNISASIKKVKFFLVEKKTKEKICIKVTHNKVFFNKRCISKNKITQFDDLKKCIDDYNLQWDTKEILIIKNENPLNSSEAYANESKLHVMFNLYD